MRNRPVEAVYGARGRLFADEGRMRAEAAAISRCCRSLRGSVMTTRRSRGEGGLHWDEARQRWIATASLGFDGRGKRITRKASGRTKTEAKNKLREILRDHEDGVTVRATSNSVGDAVRDWLAFGLAGRSPSTVANYRTIR